MNSRLCRPALLLLAASCGASLYAQSGTPEAFTAMKLDPRLTAVNDALHKVRNPGSVAISPDGALVAWTLREQATAGHDDAPAGSQIHLSSPGHPETPEKIVKVAGPAGCSNTQPVWSPDAKTLAFLSTCGSGSDRSKSGQAQIFLYDRAKGDARQLTHVTGNLNEPAWSPDGKQIAFLFVENASRSAGALDAMKPWSGVIGEDGVEIQRVDSAETQTGQTNNLTPRNLHVYEFDWAPDSKALTFVAANPPGENNWWVAKLYTEQIVNRLESTGAQQPALDKVAATPTVVLDPSTVPGPLHGLQIAVPRFSPDGSRIAFIGGLMSDQGATGGDIYLVPSKGGQPKNLTPDRKTTPAYLVWVDADKVGLTEYKGGDTRITVLDTETGSELHDYTATFPDSIGAGGLQLSVSVATGTGEVAFTRSSPSRAPEVWAGPVTAVKQITHLNDALTAVGGKTESIEWDNQGFRVQGFLTYPADYSPAKKYPMIVNVHGGPSSVITEHWGANALFSTAGYFVFQPNPRGSYGQGEKFVQANIKDFGYGDLRDILAGMDYIQQHASVDSARVGLTGWSYGGFMTMFAVTQTNRFHAAVAGAGISDWKSYYGENSIDQWMLPFFGKTVYDDPGVYAKSSAIEFIHQAKTPTLVIVGDRDGECPAPQSFEFWHALRAEGVKTQLVVYPNEGHGFRDPGHIADRNARTLAWFDTNMPATSNVASTH